MIGTLVNVGGIVVGGVVGLLVKRDLAPRHQLFLKTLLGVLVLYSGFRLTWLCIGGTLGRTLLQVVVALASLVLGNLAGRALGLQRRVNALGRHARKSLQRVQATGRPDFSEGFITGSILFCVGPMALLGALQDGLQGDPRTLIIKAVVDGVATAAFVRIFGLGTVLSALPVLASEGTITLLAGGLRPLLGNPALADGVGATVGLLVAMTSLLILDAHKGRVADYLPALVFAPLLRWFVA